MSREGIYDQGKQHVADIQGINRTLLEKAFAMRCVSYYAHIKSQLLTKTIFEIDSSNKALKGLNQQITGQRDAMAAQAQKLQEEIAKKEALAQELEEIKQGLERQVEERTAQLAASNQQLQVEVEERRQMEAELRQNRTQLVYAQKLAGMGYWSYQAEEDLFTISEVGALLLDLEGGDQAWQGNLAQILSLVQPANRLELQKALQASLAQQSKLDVDLALVTPQGKALSLHLQGEPQQGRLALQGSLVDISLRKETQAALEKAKDEAEEANRAKSNFLAVVSHELRTPLNGVLGMAELLMDAELTAQQKSFAQVIHTSGQTLLKLVEDILDLTQIETGSFTDNVTAFSPAGLVRSVANLFSPAARTKGLNLTSYISANCPKILYGDAQRMEQVLSKLVDNGIKFTDKGSVEINLSYDESHPDKVFVSVRDTGLGISQEKQSLIFHPLTQADGSSTRKVGGLGLGLTFVQRILDVLGGELGLESQPGVGSLFWFRLPIRLHSPEAEAPTQVKGVRQGRKPIKVLVVEDDSSNQEVIKAMLEQLGCEVELANNGLVALEKLFESTFPLVLMDCLMPRMDGFAATREIRRLAAEKKLAYNPRILALTALATPQDKENCLKAGMDDYLSKPILFKDLQFKLLAQLG